VRGAELTRRLLAFSRRQDLRPERVEINALVAGLAALLGRTLGENITIETNLGSAMGHVAVDPGQLENALLNLSVNARDAMPDGGRLTITTESAELDADYVASHPEAAPGIYDMIAVTDTGCGMSRDVAARAFEPFFTTKEVGKGSGLGLSMVYGFVRQSGGHVTLYSEPGLGTTIRIYLPRADAAPHDAAPGVALGRASSRGDGQRLLVVEDDPDVRQLIVMQLASLGYAVHAAASGPEALAHLATGAPVDLLLSDIVMPGGMSGLDVAAAAGAVRPGMRVLYMSGYSEGGSHKGRIAAEGAQLLAKPFSKVQLSEAVARILGDGAGAVV
jgi:CheY-like chemotaxis protein